MSEIPDAEKYVDALNDSTPCEDDDIILKSIRHAACRQNFLTIVQCCDPWYLVGDDVIEVSRENGSLVQIRRTVDQLVVAAPHSIASALIHRPRSTALMQVTKDQPSPWTIAVQPGDVVLFFWHSRVLPSDTLNALYHILGGIGHSKGSLQSLRYYLYRSYRHIDCIVFCK